MVGVAFICCKGNLIFELKILKMCWGGSPIIRLAGKNLRPLRWGSYAALGTSIFTSALLSPPFINFYKMCSFPILTSSYKKFVAVFNNLHLPFSRSMDLFECPVCFSDMVERSPRSLLCLHTFCSECLGQLVTNKRIECPTCREVTQLKSNNVQELKVNFILRQVRDQMNQKHQAACQQGQETDAVKSSLDKPLCQVCQETSAVYKCKDCPNLLCGICKSRHGDIQEFKDHSVFDLCVKHKEGITHLCKQCILPLCMKCMLLEHTQHKNHFAKYNQGIAELQNDAKKLQRKLKDKMEKAEKNYNGIDRRYQVLLETDNGLEECRKHHTARVNEVCELLRETERKKQQYKDISSTYHHERNKWRVTGASLNSLITSEAGFCEKYQKIKQKADQCLVDIQKMMDVEYTLPPFILADPSSGELVKVTAEHKGENLKLMKTVLTLAKSDEINCSGDPAFVGFDVLVASYLKPFHVIRLNKEGELVARYYPKDTQKNVLAVTVYNNDIYMLQDKTVTVISQKGNMENITYNINRNNITSMLVKDKATIFVSQLKNPGSIFKFNVLLHTIETVVQGLNNPSYMNMVYTPEGYRYIITEEQSHSIKVYNDKWEEIYTFGGFGSSDGFFNWPEATAVTDMGTLLVSDQCNHRISHFTLEGQFLSHVVTRLDGGLNSPMGICYKHPYMWVCVARANFLKCFELKKL